MHAELLNCHANVDQLALKLVTIEQKEEGVRFTSVNYILLLTLHRSPIKWRSAVFAASTFVNISRIYCAIHVHLFSIILL
jgi:hypothetical protein